MSAQECLFKIIPHGVPLRYAEIGVLRATNLVALAEMFEHMHITGFDSYNSYVDIAHGYFVSASLSKLNHEIAVKKIASSPHASRIDLVVEDSSVASHKTENGAYDVVFIDKSLSAEGQAQDIVDWHTKVRFGGLLCGHDAGTPCIFESVVATLRSLGLPTPNVVGGEVWFVEIGV